MLVILIVCAYFLFKFIVLVSLDSTDPKPARHLNLTLLIKSYVSKFEQSSLNGALHYFFLLRNCTDSEDRNLFEVLVSDLAINTKDYERIFGKLQANGVKTKGLIHQFKNIDFKVETVAQTLVQKELFEEAIELYDAVNVSSFFYFILTMSNIYLFICLRFLQNKP